MTDMTLHGIVPIESKTSRAAGFAAIMHVATPGGTIRRIPLTERGLVALIFQASNALLEVTRDREEATS